MTEVERIRAFMRGIDERSSDRLVPFAHGTAYLNQSLPDVYDRNFLVVTGSPPDEALPEIVEAAERIHAEAGQRHRKLIFEDPAYGERMAPLLAAMTWEIRPLWVMAHRGEPPEPAGDAREVEPPRLERARAESMRTQPSPHGEPVIAQLIENDRVIGRATHERAFASLVDGEVASWARLFSDGAIAQIEDVATLERFRHGGHSKAVVTRAIAEAKKDHEVVFINADASDWPKDWYARLGFEPATVQWQALRVYTP